MAIADLFQTPQAARFCVGIDLGTTNCSVAFIDTQADQRQIAQFKILQLVDLGTHERLETLPSFHYQFASEHATDMKDCVGVFARARGIDHTGRVVASAKSWLCHAGVDRSAKLLPWHADTDVLQFSPAEICSKFLGYIRQCWDDEHPTDLLADQDVVVTLPASFDEIARELTVLAAREAGLQKILLVEEPQAAFYAYLASHQRDWHERIHAGQCVLVCDIGGGTTDFTLIRVKQAEQSVQTDATRGTDDLVQRYGLHRVAVGEHLLLGGDNLDAALAAYLEQSVAPEQDQPLTPRQWDSLRMQCRRAKEELLGVSAPDQTTIFIAGQSAKLINAGKTFLLTQQATTKLLIDGFLPIVPLDANPDTSAVGFREFGLPYASDAAITKHLAKFLWQHRMAGRESDDPKRQHNLLAARPDWILFNGGVTSSPVIRNRIIEQINGWFVETQLDGLWQCRELTSPSLDLAVSRGAAYFALSRRGEGLEGENAIAIEANLARAYYMFVQAEPPRVMCIMPANAKTDQAYRFDQLPLRVQVGQPVQFPLYYSSTRLIDSAGDVVDLDPLSMSPLPTIQTVLRGNNRKRSTTDAVIESSLSEIGTLQLFLETKLTNDSENTIVNNLKRRWKLEFDLRSTVQSDRVHHAGQAEQGGFLVQDALLVASDILNNLFGDLNGSSNNQSKIPATKNILQNIAQAIDLPRNQWPASFLRDLWNITLLIPLNLRKQVDAESRWLNLLGYFLRPGFGYAADDWRVSETWRLVAGKLQHHSNSQDAIVLWRRIAGGFTAGQQLTLLQEQQTTLQKIINNQTSGASTGYSNEVIRLIGSLELAGFAQKRYLVDIMLPTLKKAKLQSLHAALYWSIGRLASRQPVYGPLNCVISTSAAEDTLKRLLQIQSKTMAWNWCVAQIARKTADRYRDVSTSIQDKVLSAMRTNQASLRQLAQVDHVTELSQSETSELLGESLPLGLQLF